MKYRVTYQLTHPQSLPVSKSEVVAARTHAELDARLVKIVARWLARGYAVRVTEIVEEKRKR